MQEQTALLMKHQGESVFVADDDEPEHVWQDLKTAVEELELEGWQVAAPPLSSLTLRDWTALMSGGTG